MRSENRLQNRVLNLFKAVFVALIVGQPVPALAESFKNSDFLQLDSEAQKFWIAGAIETLVHVATAKNSQTGQCVYDWYHTETPKKNGLIFASMEKYPTASPSSIFLALTERSCGAYRK